MPRIERTADVTWTGNVARGQGKLSGGSGALQLMPFTLATRIGEPEGKTSPEELLAGAVGTCFTMSLANELSQAKTPPEMLSVDVKTVMDEVGDRHLVTEVQLHVRGRVPGLDAAQFEEAAQRAEAGCPLAHLVRGTAAVTLSASLDES